MKTESLLRDEKEADILRKSGIEAVGNIPWGTHLCQFYETKEDLIDILVPYFVKGLRNNEFCMLVTSPPLGVEEARAALQKAVPDLEQYIKKGQIEILPHTDWYLLGGEFDADRVLRGWVEKEKGALNRGFAGLRLTGNTFWIEGNCWKSFVDYEATVNDVIGEHRMIAICTYSLEKCTGSDVVDVMKNHESVLFKKGETWILAEDVLKRRLLEKKVRKSEEKFRNIFENASDCLVYLDSSGRILEVNRKAVEMFGGSKEELLGKHFTRVSVLSPRDIPMIMSAFAKALAGKKTTYNTCIKNKKGQEIHVEVSGSLMKMDGKLAGLLVVARDVTERKRAEQALRESEEKLRGIFSTMPDGVTLVGLDGSILDCNDAVLRLHGVSRDEYIGRNVYDFIAPEDRKRAIQEASEVLEEGFIRSEVKALRKEGGTFDAEINVSLLRDASGKPTAFLGVTRDITERKRMEEKFRESEERFRNLYESIQDPVGVYVGREGRLIAHNKAFNKLSGYTDEELKDKTFLDFVHPDDQAVVLEKYRTKYPEEELPLVYEIRAVNKKGETVPIEISVSTYKVKGKVVGIEVIHRDIIERKQMEEKLRQYSEHLEELIQKRTEELLESEKRYSVLVEEASDGVGIIQDGKVIFVNKKAAEIVGYSRDELIGLPFEKAVDEKYLQLAMEGYMGRLRGETLPAIAELELIAKTGERIPIEANSTLIHYQGRPATLVIMRDVRERKRMEEERLKLEKLATIGELATMVGHDLRNPLQAIENATYYLNNELPRLPPFTPIPQKALEMLQIINDSVNYADKIIRDLHDFSATKKPILKKTNINAIVNETLSQVETPKNVGLITELGRLPEIKADKDMMKRAFLNLAINGIQAMEKGGTLKVSTKKTGGAIEVSFKDTGIGIPKENTKKIFAPFFTTRAKGMGMGLPICKKFVEIHGGTIEVESKEGKGSTFTVKLPIQQDDGGESQ